MLLMHSRIHVQTFSMNLMTQGNHIPAMNVFKSLTYPSSLNLIWSLSAFLTHSINRIPQLKVDARGRAQTYFWTHNAVQYTEVPLLLEIVGWRQAECVGDRKIKEHSFFPTTDSGAVRETLM